MFDNAEPCPVTEVLLAYFLRISPLRITSIAVDDQLFPKVPFGDQQGSRDGDVIGLERCLCPIENQTGRFVGLGAHVMDSVGHIPREGKGLVAALSGTAAMLQFYADVIPGPLIAVSLGPMPRASSAG